VQLPGCTVADDFNHALGDPAENRLAAALFYRSNSSCSTSISIDGPLRQQVQSVTNGVPLIIAHDPLRENRILGLPNAQ
jgi:hypothetical protein